MDRQELFIDNNIVELTDDVAVALNFLIADIAEPENRKADYSKTINLPGSEKINKLFSHIYNVNIDLTHSSASFNPNIRVSASYAVNSVELIDGYLQLKKVNIKDGCISYEVNIFGRNAKGKSSIIGALMYCLFNTSDRGTIKNIHVVNSRKNMCKADVDFTISGNRFRISRKTIKKTTKSGEWAPTSLDFFRLDNNGEIIEDLSDEQRRSTENVIRKMIGTSEEFLLTSLASQGEMNQFIKEKATAINLKGRTAKDAYDNFVITKNQYLELIELPGIKDGDKYKNEYEKEIE